MERSVVKFILQSVSAFPRPVGFQGRDQGGKFHNPSILSRIPGNVPVKDVGDDTGGKSLIPGRIARL
jgi:hypothetical protein